MSSHPASIDETELAKDCDVKRSRGSGPGGQHRNKVETAIVVTHRPTGIMGSASERRSQKDNQREATFRLRVNLAIETRTDPDEGDVSELWRSRCRGGSISVNAKHADFPSLLAEALDHLTQDDMDVKVSAERLGCSVSQLVKFLKIEPRALEIVNIRRKQLDLRSLR